jgi:putative endonuclease
MPVKSVMPYVYILANRPKTLYIGVTSDLYARMYQHKNHLTPGFATRYGLDRLVYFEEISEMIEAIAREKQLKVRTRAKKVALIEAMNPEWKDLSEDWF